MFDNIWIFIPVFLLFFSITPSVIYGYIIIKKGRSYEDHAMPCLVKCTAFGCFALGQLCVPWICLPMFYGVLIFIFFLKQSFLFGAFFFLLGLGSLFQMMSSFHCFSIGARLLYYDRSVIKDARKLSTRIIWQGLLMAFLILLSLKSLQAKPPWPIKEIVRYMLLLCILLPGFHIVFALLQSILLKISATKIEKVHEH